MSGSAPSGHDSVICPDFNNRIPWLLFSVTMIVISLGHCCWDRNCSLFRKIIMRLFSLEEISTYGPQVAVLFLGLRHDGVIVKRGLAMSSLVNSFSFAMATSIFLLPATCIDKNTPACWPRNNTLITSSVVIGAPSDQKFESPI